MDTKDNKVMNAQEAEEKSKPYRCPVCGGNGLVPSGYYSQTTGHWPATTIAFEPCRSCNGSGIVWRSYKN